jgi:O-antigen/teichoic acid export membrane protein
MADVSTSDAHPPVLDYNAGAEASTMKLDVLSAYAASAARIISWIVTSAAVYRLAGAGAFAVLSLVRATIGILNYASVGLAPAMIRLLAEAKAARTSLLNQPDSDGSQIRVDPVRAVYVNGVAWGLTACGVAFVLLLLYAHWIRRSPAILSLGTGTERFVILFGIGVIIRLLSDAPSAVLQTSGLIALDNAFVVAEEALWAIVSVALLLGAPKMDWGFSVGWSFLVTSLLLLIVRWLAASTKISKNAVSRFRHFDLSILKRLFGLGSLITLAQLADYLYAPTDFILISLFLPPLEAATYSPAVQIDAGLLMLVGAIASVILPKAALAHVSENRQLVRRYYVLGTLASVGILLFTASGTYAISKPLFRLWFNRSMNDTRAILPLVLIHTVIGGSSQVGRSILLGMGKVAPFTISVIVAGVSNVLLSILFVTHFHMGLRGIILGTICAVVGRCGIWMPWYVIRTLNRAREDSQSMDA